METKEGKASGIGQGLLPALLPLYGFVELTSWVLRCFINSMKLTTLSSL